MLSIDVSVEIVIPTKAGISTLYVLF